MEDTVYTIFAIKFIIKIQFIINLVILITYHIHTILNGLV